VTQNRPTLPLNPQPNPIPEVETPVLIPPQPTTNKSVSNTEVQCPICFRPFKSPQQVDLHIDNCISASARSHNLRPPKPNRVQVSAPSTSQLLTPLPQTPLPKINYALYSEKQLRALLCEYGLPTSGNKSLLSARHKEYVSLYNSNLDRSQPLSQQELVRLIERWDSIQNNPFRGEKRKIDTEEWGKKFSDDFAELARRARESAKRKKVETETTTGNGDGNGTRELTVVVSSSQEETVV
jgi:E3 ubiquitin-protein ligase RAD18